MAIATLLHLVTAMMVLSFQVSVSGALAGAHGATWIARRGRRRPKPISPPA